MEIPNELNVIYTDDFTSTALYTVTLLQTENNSMLQVALESVPNLGCIYITGTSKVVSFVGHYHIHNTNQKCEPYVILTHNRHTVVWEIFIVVLFSSMLQMTKIKQYENCLHNIAPV